MRPPSEGRWTARYGPRTNPVTGKQETHHGLDINAASGRLLVAPAACTLIGYGVVPGWEAHGRVARLLDDDGYEHWLSHTEYLVHGRAVGDRLSEGDPIAMQGLTGQTTGMHVHWETRLNGSRLDPEAWLARPQSGTDTPFTPEPEEDDDMDRISYARDKTQGSAGTVWAVDLLKGTRRAVTPGEWDTIRATIPGVQLAEIPTARLATIPIGS